MRIIYLHQYFNTPEMPGGSRSYEMARRLVKKGHEVHMITSWRESGKGKNWFETNENGIRVHWIPVTYSNHMGYAQRIKSFFKFAFKSAQKAKKIKADIIFATSTPLTIAFPAIYASKRQKIPMIFEVRDLWPKIPIAIGAIKNPIVKKASYWIEKWAYKNSEAVVALSPGMKEGIINAGYDHHRIATIPNSCDNDFFNNNPDSAFIFRQQREWLKDRPLLLYSGTFGKINGVSYLVELANYLKDIAPEVRILLVGDGVERSKVYEKAKEAEVLEKNLFIENKVSRTEIPAILSAADISSSVVIDLPILAANSANKFFDSLAAGRPVFLNYGGWQAELIKNNNCGIVACNKSLPEVAEIVAEKIQDTQWLKTAGNRARKLAVKHFDRDKLAAQLEQVLSSAFHKKGYKAKSIAPGIY